MNSSPDNQHPDHKPWLIFVCMLAGLVHGGYFLIHDDPQLEPDEIEYIQLSRYLADNSTLALPSGEVAKRMPLYPALMSLIYRTQPADVWPNAVMALQSFIAWCSTIMIALVAYRSADGRAGGLAGIITALYVPFAYLQMSFLTETLLIFLFSASLLLYVTFGLKPNSSIRRPAALLGVSFLLGLAILTRANALLLLPPFVVDTVFRSGSVTQRTSRVAFLVIPALACASVWAARNHREVGAFTLSTVGGLNFYLGHNPDYAADPGLDRLDYGIADRLRTERNLTERQTDKFLFDRGFDFIRNHPGETILNSFKKISAWFSPRVPVYGPTVPMLILVVLAAAGWSRWRDGALIDRRLALFRIAVVGAPLLAVFWLFQTLSYLNRHLDSVPLPFTSPLYVLSIGVPALLFLRSRLRIKGLLIGLVAGQLVVAIAFIPLSRLRWTVDGLLIIAIAIGVSNLCRWLQESPSRPT